MNRMYKVSFPKPLASLLLALPLAAAAQQPSYQQTVSGIVTQITVSDLSLRSPIDPMIYGQMLEDCNDQVVYGGVADTKGRLNTSVVSQLQNLHIPVVRWPAGTAIYDYEWKRGVGPQRTAVPEKIWGGTEYYTFGTDEFINWCGQIGAEPYINIPMGNNNTYAHSLDDAIDWVEYVNGSTSTPQGALRASYGHPEPYGVKYWCLGNENYLGNRFHQSESAATYAALLLRYASVIKRLYPEVSLLGVGHTGTWNKTVFEQCSDYIDFLTLHYYLTAKVNDATLLNPLPSLFAPAKVEANIRRFSAELDELNAAAGRSQNPVRFSIDEWNCRHSVYDGANYNFTRKDARRLYDVAMMAGMLNVFVRTSPNVGMANYIFPVNGHGLLKTVGSDDAYASACYPVFDLYRRYLTGHALSLSVKGPGQRGINLSSLNLSGDADSALKNQTTDLCYIDCAAALNDSNQLCLALVNRSYDTRLQVRLSVPQDYTLRQAWAVSHTDVCAENTASDRDNVKAEPFDASAATFTVQPCALVLVVFEKPGGGETGLVPLRPHSPAPMPLYYDLAGRRLASGEAAPRGLYVVRAGEQSCKIMGTAN